MTILFENLSDFAMDTIQQLGEEALSYYGKGKETVKFDEGLITEAELHLTEFFEEQLNANFPEHQMFQYNLEENAGYTHDDRRFMWIFDPLDGVASFQAGIPMWGMSLALVENFWPVFGIFYMPATGDLYRARAGEKAFWNDQAIYISDQNHIDDESLLLTYSRFHLHYHSNFPGKIRNLGCTGAHICYVAMGRADAAIIANESYQDLAATQIIVEAAGGKIFKLDGSDFFLGDYMNGQKINDHLLVTSPDFCSQVLSFLNKSN